MDQEIVNVIMQFMQRVQLQGAEVPAYNRVMQELSNLLQEQPTISQAVPVHQDEPN